MIRCRPFFGDCATAICETMLLAITPDTPMAVARRMNSRRSIDPLAKIARSCFRSRMVISPCSACCEFCLVLVARCSVRGSSLIQLVLHEPRSEYSSGKINGGHEEERKDQQREPLPILEESKRCDQLKADAAGSYEPHDGRGPQIMLPTIKREIDHSRQNLR